MLKGQIVKALSGFYYIRSGEDVYQTRARGIFRKHKITPLVGDFVEFTTESLDDGTLEVILERKNELVRPPIANIDAAVVVMSAIEPEFSSNLVDRFLVYLEAKKIHPIIVITKTDLLTPDQYQTIQTIQTEYESIGYRVWLSDILRKDQTAFFHEISNQTIVFMGQSGVGKSTLLNQFLPHLELETGEISTALGRGKHTTRHVALHEVHQTLIADTPGFSTVHFDDIEKEQLPYCFPEFLQYSADCKFRECSHTNEPHCAVKQALEQGAVLSSRYQHYVAFLDEISTRKPKYKK